jgi:peptidyl-prolyl cis-trans isomerase SurA
MLNARQPAHILTPEHDFARIEELAMNHKSQELFNAWIEKLKKEVVVKVMSDV